MMTQTHEQQNWKQWATRDGERKEGREGERWGIHLGGSGEVGDGYKRS